MVLSSSNISMTADDIQTSLLRIIFGRYRSKCLGLICSIPIPKFARPRAWIFLSYLLKIKTDETEKDLDRYRSFNKFFCRRLKPGLRSVDKTLHKSIYTSAADGKVVSHEALDVKARWVKQVKGTNYNVDRFIGEKLPDCKPGHSWFSTVFYLSPSDYHRFHSPCNFTVTDRHHISGEMLPVSIAFTSIVSNVFALNERVVYKGFNTDNNNRIYYGAVAAYNVGNIRLSKQDSFRSNRRYSSLKDISYLNDFGSTVCDLNDNNSTSKENLLTFERGEEMGYFMLGSTVVIIYEAPIETKFDIAEYRNIQVGDPLWYT